MVACESGTCYQSAADNPVADDCQECCVSQSCRSNIGKSGQYACHPHRTMTLTLRRLVIFTPPHLSHILWMSKLKEFTLGLCGWINSKILYKRGGINGHGRLTAARVELAPRSPSLWN